jgi:hypothetical protein
MHKLWILLGVLPLLACDDAADDTATDAAVVDAAMADAAVADAAVEADAGPPARRGAFTHSFGTFELEPFEERQGCVAWTLENEASVYVERFEFQSGGSFHHSNWFVVPENTYPGPDGFFDCGERGFDELASAAAGTVVFAQSTQADFEEQFLGAGIVIKVPPRHKLVAGVHMLNLSAATTVTHLRLTMDIIHPGDIKTIVSPFRMNYLDLQIPAQRASHHTASCDFASAYERIADRPFDLKLYWVLPHYHYLGNYFDLSIVGGPRDGESLLRLEQFDAEPHGKAFDPPIDLTGAQGLAVTCGYDNPRPVDVGYGVGDQEMCVMLGFAESATLMDGSVNRDSTLMGEDLGIAQYTGPCNVFGVPKNAGQGPPTEAELTGVLYVPPSDADPEAVGGPPPCVDTPADAVAAAAGTLENARDIVFHAGCAFSACHGGARPAGGLDLSGEDLRDVLLNHTPASGGGLPLVAPGDPEGSWLYRRIAKCDPGGGSPHMPLNAAELLNPGHVAVVRDWIAAGAQ